MAASQRLSDQVVVIIGGSSGMGLATAKEALAEGAARVILCGRSAARLESAREALASPGRVEIAAFDASDEAAVAAFFAGFEDGSLHHLVTTAGAGVARGTFHSLAVAKVSCAAHGRMPDTHRAISRSRSPPRSASSSTPSSG